MVTRTVPVRRPAAATALKSMVHNGRSDDVRNPDRVAARSRGVANALRSEPASAPRQT